MTAVMFEGNANSLEAYVAATTHMSSAGDHFGATMAGQAEFRASLAQPKSVASEKSALPVLPSANTTRLVENKPLHEDVVEGATAEVLYSGTSAEKGPASTISAVTAGVNASKARSTSTIAPNSEPAERKDSFTTATTPKTPASVTQAEGQVSGSDASAKKGTTAGEVHERDSSLAAAEGTGNQPDPYMNAATINGNVSSETMPVIPQYVSPPPSQANNGKVEVADATTDQSRKADRRIVSIAGTATRPGGTKSARLGDASEVDAASAVNGSPLNAEAGTAAVNKQIDASEQQGVAVIGVSNPVQRDLSELPGGVKKSTSGTEGAPPGSRIKSGQVRPGSGGAQQPVSTTAGATGAPTSTDTPPEHGGSVEHGDKAIVIEPTGSTNSSSLSAQIANAGLDVKHTAGAGSGAPVAAPASHAGGRGSDSHETEVASPHASEPMQVVTISNEVQRPGQSGPSSLEVGVSTGTQGWLKIRAEVGVEGVHASLSSSSVSGQSLLHQQLPALNAYLAGEKIHVSAVVSDRSGLQQTATGSGEQREQRGTQQRANQESRFAGHSKSIEETYSNGQQMGDGLLVSLQRAGSGSWLSVLA